RRRNFGWGSGLGFGALVGTRLLFVLGLASRLRDALGQRQAGDRASLARNGRDGVIGERLGAATETGDGSGVLGRLARKLLLEGCHLAFQRLDGRDLFARLLFEG